MAVTACKKSFKKIVERIFDKVLKYPKITEEKYGRF